MLTQAQVKEMFEYREDGKLIRKSACMGNGNYVGRVVGNYGAKNLGTRSCRYISTKIHGKHYSVHKLIYLWHTGEWPTQIDHINRNTFDNRIENLRLADSTQNSMNRKLFSNNTSGAKGVSWNKVNAKWFVYVDVGKKRKNIGYFKDLELAELVAEEARNKYHGVYANHF